MKKKFALSALALTSACSSILCFGQEQESSKIQSISKSIPVNHKKTTSKQDTNKNLKTVDDQKVPSSFPNRGKLLQEGKNDINQQPTLPVLDYKSQTSGIPVTNVLQEVAQNPDKKTTNNDGQINIESQTPEQTPEVAATISETPVLMSFPAASIGTWTVQVDPDWLVTISISADGTVSRLDQPEGYAYYAQPQSVHFNGVYDRGNGYYELVGNNGTNQSIMIIAGIGGANIKYSFGMHLEGDKLIPVLWQTGIDSEFNFESPLSGPTLIKQ